MSDETELEQMEVPVHGVLVVEGIETGDRRRFAAGALTWRDLPLPISWPKQSGEGHKGSVVVGRIEELERAEDGTFPWSGFMNCTPESGEVVSLIANRDVRGISVDVDSVVMELQTRDGRNAFEVMAEDGEVDENDVVETITSGRASGGTIVPIPAFMEAYIALGPRPQQEAVAASGEFRDVPQGERDKLSEEGKALPDGSFPIANVDDLKNAIQAIGRAKDPEKAKAHIKKRAKALGEESLIPEDWAASTAEFSGDAVAAQSAHDIVADLPLEQEVKDQLAAADVDDLPEALRSIAADLEPQDAEAVLAAADKIESLLEPGDVEEPEFPDEDALRASAAEVLAFADVAPGRTEDGPGWLTHPIDTDRLRDYWVRGPGAAKIGWGAPGDFNRCRAFLAEHIKPQYLSGYCANRHFDALGTWPGRGAHSVEALAAAAGEHPEQVGPAYNVVAAAGPVVPPIEWFANPNLTEPSPLTITKEGRVFGHVATWGTCHVGFPGSCVTPPSSPSEYAYFLSGVVETTEGDVRVGQITFDTGHADLQANSRKALAHYDNTGTVGADVMAGEDEHGIWVAGAVRPGVTDEQIRTMRGAKMSGDWRSIGGELEMVAVLAVNTPGFPIPRPALAASAGRQTALVAAGVVPEPEPTQSFSVEEIVRETLRQQRDEQVRAEAKAEIQSIAASLASADIERTVASMEREVQK